MFKLSKLVRLFAYLCALLIGLGLCFLAIVTVANFSDPDLRPEVAAMLAAQPTPLMASENAYMNLVALAAPADKESDEWAKHWMNSAQKVTDQKTFEAHNATFSSNPGQKQTPYCRPGEKLCLAEALMSPESRSALAKLLSAESELIRRYAQFSVRPAFSEPAFVASEWAPTPPVYGVMRYAQSLLFANVAFMAEDGDLPAALALLERDARGYRQMLAGARSLHVKLMATRALGDDLLVASELTHRYREGMRALAPRLEAMAEGLTPDQRALRALGETETRSASGFFATVKQNPQRAGALINGGELPLITARLFGLAYQPNATINLYYELMQPMLDIDAKGAPGIALASAEQQARLDKLAGLSLINPAGKQLAQRALPRFDQTATLIFDLEGLTRLLRLQAKALSYPTAAEAFPSLLTASGETLTDPYSGQPAIWDATKGRMSFVGRSSANSPRLTIQP